MLLTVLQVGDTAENKTNKALICGSLHSSLGSQTFLDSEKIKLGDYYNIQPFTKSTNNCFVGVLFWATPPTHPPKSKLQKLYVMNS